MQVRALVEGQLLSMRGHAERFGMPSPPKRIIATGGASANQNILKTIAAIFGCDVYTVQRTGTWTFPSCSTKFCGLLSYSTRVLNIGISGCPRAFGMGLKSGFLAPKEA